LIAETERGMRHLVRVVFLSLTSFGVFAASTAADTKVVSLEQALGSSALIGHMVEIETCAGIPQSDAPDQDNFIVLFPCGANLSDPDNLKAALGRASAATIFKPASGWDMRDSPAFKGRFRGVLRKDARYGEDMKDVLVMELSEVEFHASVDIE
jgi:hypothetical protein